MANSPVTPITDGDVKLLPVNVVEARQLLEHPESPVSTASTSSQESSPLLNGRPWMHRFAGGYCTICNTRNGQSPGCAKIINGETMQVRQTLLTAADEPISESDVFLCLLLVTVAVFVAFSGGKLCDKWKWMCQMFDHTWAKVISIPVLNAVFRKAIRYVPRQVISREHFILTLLILTFASMFVTFVASS